MAEENQPEVNEQEKSYTFQVTATEANIILAGLGELPAKVSISVIQKIQAQASLQQ